MRLTIRLNFLLMLLSLSVLGGCSGDGSVDEEFQSDYKKSRVRAVLNSLDTGKTNYIEDYISADTYIEHNLSKPDGRQALLDLVSSGATQGTALATWRLLNDGDFVAVHSDYIVNDVRRIAFDVYRFENDLIVEHWDNWQDKVEPVTSGRGMINGNTGIDDKEKRDSNKAIVERFTNEILMARQYDNLESFFFENDYIQHTVLPIEDGVSAFRAYIENIGDNLQYTTLHKVLGEGNFVLTMSEGTKDGEHTAFYDLYRLKDDIIEEHWDVIETIPSQDTWQNNNGKF